MPTILFPAQVIDTNSGGFKLLLDSLNNGYDILYSSAGHYDYFNHSNWRINQDKNKAEELYNFIVSNKKLFTTTRNLTGIVD